MTSHSAFSSTGYLKLSSYYFFYFMLFGALLPYLSLYYQSLGLSAIDIGQLMGIFVGTKIVAPNVFGWLADRQGRRVLWIQITGALTVVGSLGLLMFDAFWGLALTIFMFSFFFHSGLPLFESYTMETLQQQKTRYGRIRLWGSIGFIVAVVGLGWAIDRYGITVLPAMLVSFAVLAWFSSWHVQEHAKPSQMQTGLSVSKILRQPWVVSLLVVSILIQFSHGAYYSFYSIHLTDHGYDKTTIAWLWALGVLAEIAVFFWMPKIFKHYRVKSLILLSLWLTLIRWVMIPAFPDTLWALMFAQTLHAASYGLFHAAAIHLIDEHFHGVNRSKGQAIYASTSHGLGGGLGMVVAGYAWHAGGAGLAFGMGAVAVALAWIIAWKWIDIRSYS